ncbi:DUF4129 domain-containing protein [Brevundimonas lenta]|uniref:Protein-glutamine gamma-glutamyltransferase-like C-terminal domain-containing protein n=1 Tax=Brevundimonas lenta TaxID=424796 RepID=A0A7W6JET8_9CAUL|nr:DUF4129 domain-containing protein [Brevundimonas lenta]MBB4083741.1 hypothetical protein [Brevundimonas lenta]
MQERASPTDDALAQAHARLLADDSLQFDRAGFDPPEIPAWFGWIGEFLRAIAPVLNWVFWIGLALIVGLIVFGIGREVLRLRAPRPKAEKPKAAATAEWRPDARAARDLLAEADALAAQGQYAEATHLLLLRSVEDIEKLQPRAVRVSLTTREIAQLKALPEAARPAFARIGWHVERSLFGHAQAGPEDFAECRQAYEAFALPAGARA